MLTLHGVGFTLIFVPQVVEDLNSKLKSFVRAFFMCVLSTKHLDKHNLQTIKTILKMKRLFIMVCAVILSTAAYADGTKTCRVSGTDGSVEVSVNVTDEEKGICILTFSNDTDRNVNVRYTVSDRGSSQMIPGSKLVYANSEQTQQINFKRPVSANNVTVNSLSGQKCD